MILDLVGRAWVRLFGPRATSVSPKTSREDAWEAMKPLLDTAPQLPWCFYLGGDTATEPVRIPAITPDSLDRVEAAAARVYGTTEPVSIEIIPPFPWVDPHQRGAHPDAEPVGAAIIRGEDHWVPRETLERDVGLKPPADPKAEGWTWEKWQAEFITLQLPGWAPCRFVHRAGEHKAIFVFGVTRGAFGLWKKPLEVTTYHADKPPEVAQDVLTIATHLRSGCGMGVFETRELAMQACELAERVAAGWERLDPFEDPPAWRLAVHYTQKAWFDIGLRNSTNAAAKDDDDSIYAIIGMSAASAMEGKPEKPS